MPRDLLLGRYPAFVTGGRLAPGEVPVFVLHEAEPVSFAHRLDHLARNDYRTLSIDEYVAVLRGSVQAPERAVLLTFDDGRGSVWSVAAPLLQRHGMRAVVFLVPGRVPSHAPRPAGQDAALMSWEEIGALVRGGLFEFQSHTLLHARVHTGPRLAGFVTPESRRGYAAFDQPLVREGERDLVGTEVPLGTPLFRSSPRTSEDLRFFEDPSLRSACVAAVADAGGDAFFQGSNWRSRLRQGLAQQAGHGADRDETGTGGGHPARARRGAQYHRGARRPPGRPPVLSVARRRRHGASLWRPRSATRPRSAARSTA